MAESQQENETFVNQTLVSETEEESEEFEQVDIQEALENQTLTSENDEDNDDFERLELIEPLETIKIPKVAEQRKNLLEQEKEKAEIEEKLKVASERHKELGKQLEKKFEAQERENAEIEAKLKAATERRKELERLIAEKLRARDQELEETNESK
ncbi:hypothetical protein F8M41_019437 [Gigaspora margarita]|uniref:Uncharacterized protein n=1 Tax=Gigaspora margarita TaxID=4874 RepID=A0A8H4AK57_GIGMA|nr:hypothetical protein F8M41_019437 [Gigaspora margarita]